MTHPTRAVVDLEAIRDNVGLLAGIAGTPVMAMVKADAYGHGAVPVARAALEAGAAWLGVAFVEEALALRAAGIIAPVLVGVIPPGTDVEPAVAADVDLGAGTLRLLAEIADAAARVGRTARVHLKADTGMSRGGTTEREWPALVEAALKAEAAGTVSVVGIWSHLACSDEPDHPSVARQTKAFAAMVGHAEAAGIRPEVRHLANSSAVLHLPETHWDLVRPGIAVYGLNPAPDLPDPGLRPAMTVTSTVTVAKRVPEGSGVSYGHLYTTDRETTVALVPAGYADGVPRGGSGILEVLAAGRRRRIAGRVCMDQFVIDVGDDPVAEGDEVVLFGPGDRGEATATDWAHALGTVSYEIVTRLGGRVPRVHLDRRTTDARE
ncbi:alanine racemase [Actinocorallia sp. API 0066]|uniref:alanine racemase n=1 Tax=Actinocorallia sp. API 0066 TaxID=2896846 RepID=UPI001E427E44|nr:alanine racemase [Actinocorallia sp. API 0066]MCD0447646.1 alanine racemase [Actinocorallia sp. API 0066]